MPHKWTSSVQASPVKCVQWSAFSLSKNGEICSFRYDMNQNTISLLSWSPVFRPLYQDILLPLHWSIVPPSRVSHSAATLLNRPLFSRTMVLSLVCRLTNWELHKYGYELYHSFWFKLPKGWLWHQHLYTFIVILVFSQSQEPPEKLGNLKSRPVTILWDYTIKNPRDTNQVINRASKYLLPVGFASWTLGIVHRMITALFQYSWKFQVSRALTSPVAFQCFPWSASPFQSFILFCNYFKAFKALVFNYEIT